MIRRKLFVRDCRHWWVILGNWFLERWCPGAPCRLPHVQYEPHRVRAGRVMPR